MDRPHGTGVVRALLGSAAALTLLGMLPYDVVRDAMKYAPTKASTALTSARPVAEGASPGGALLALALTAAVTLVLASALLKRRDV
ncbi:hypothetical protein [Streptomyces sp. NPDC059092]|uniref:hypothetical protein n=1 Tax=Streptomyces sp. NPDC059092 TaxID=3346725 RepID=UPI0036BFE106